MQCHPHNTVTFCFQQLIIVDAVQRKYFPPKYFETNKLLKSCVVLSHLCMTFIELAVFNFSGTNDGKERVFLNFSVPARGFDIFCSPTLFLVYSTHLGRLSMVFQPCSKIMNGKERHSYTNLFQTCITGNSA